MLDATSSVDLARVPTPAAAAPPTPWPARVPVNAEGVPSPTDPPRVPGAPRFKPWGDDGFSFKDVLDVVNPLQHIPIVSTIYRTLTGDNISPASRVIGDTLFGGPIGAVVGVADAVVEGKTGRDIGGNVYAYLMQDDLSHPPTAVAANDWKDPDKQPLAGAPDRLLAAATPAPQAAFVPPAKPDLGVLSAFDTAAGPAKGTQIEPIGLQPRPADQIDDAPTTPADPPGETAASDPDSGDVPPPSQAALDSWHPHSQPLVPTDMPKGALRTMRNLYSKGPTPTPIPDPTSTAVRDAALKQLEDQTKSAEDDENDWVAKKMMLALDKYSQSAKLGSLPDSETGGQSVVR